jgi:hypothetical protein
VPARKRKVNYPPPRTATRQPAPTGLTPTPGQPRPTVVAIDLTAGAGQAGLSVGDRVVINGTGLYAGETARIERLTGGIIPGAVVRTDAGRARQVRTIDLSPIAEEA